MLYIIMHHTELTENRQKIDRAVRNIVKTNIRKEFRHRLHRNQPYKR